MSMMSSSSSILIKTPLELISNKSLSTGGAFLGAIADNNTCEVEPTKPKKTICDTQPNYIKQSEQSLFNNKEFKSKKEVRFDIMSDNFTSSNDKKNSVSIDRISDPKLLKFLKFKLNKPKLPQTIFGFGDENTIRTKYSVAVSKNGTVTLIFQPKESIFYTKEFKGSGWLDFSNAVTMDKVLITNQNKKISIQDAMIEAGFMNKCWNNIEFGGHCFKRDELDKPIKTK